LKGGYLGVFKDREHYVRAAILFAVGVAAFLGVRAVLVPKGFGAYGHYRSGALADNRARKFSFAGHAACEECHTDVAELRTGSRHEQVGCEACHGPLARHAEDPDAVAPTLPDPATLCLRCHLENVSRPAGFPQVNPRDHAGDETCTSCHRPHHPETS
jgi:hypothetical protein